MSDFLIQLAGAAVGCVVVSVALILALTVVADMETLAPTRGDAIIGWIVGTVAVVVLTVATAALFPDASMFVKQLGFGAGIGVMSGGGQLLAWIRGHRRNRERATAA